MWRWLDGDWWMGGWKGGRNVMDKWYSISQLSQLVEIPETTVRRYLNKFERYFRFEQRGRGKKYHPGSMEILQRIALLYTEEYEASEIEEVLSKDFAFTIDEGKKEVTVIQSPNKNIELQFEEFKQQQEQFNKQLLNQLKKQQEYINNKLEERDRILIESIREIQEAKQEIASSNKQEKKSFFFRLFKRSKYNPF